MKQIDLSVIVPAYSKQDTIVKDLLTIHHVLTHLRCTSELICVVDGMMDETYSRASKLAKRYPDIKVIGYSVNKGKGHAVRFGMAKSRGNIIAFIDAGMDINPNGLSMILEHFEWYSADIIVGSKRHPVSKVIYPWQRKIFSWCYQLLVRLLFNLKVRDTQVGLKCFRRQVLEIVLPRLVTNGYTFDVEILAVSNYLGFNRIYEAPVELTLDFGGSSVLTGSKLFYFCQQMLQDTLKLFYRLRIEGYYATTNKQKWHIDPELSFN